MSAVAAFLYFRSPGVSAEETVTIIVEKLVIVCSGSYLS